MSAFSGISLQFASGKPIGIWAQIPHQCPGNAKFLFVFTFCICTLGLGPFLWCKHTSQIAIYSIRFEYISILMTLRDERQSTKVHCLQLEEKVDKTRLARFPLAYYALHTGSSSRTKDVVSRVHDAIKCPKKPYLGACNRTYGLGRHVQWSIDALGGGRGDS